MTTKIRNKDNNYKVTFSPTKEQLDEIEKWLIDENKIANSGFYCNWKIIISSFNVNELATISLNNETIGFVIWSIISDKTARIEIAEVKPSFRNSGFGKKLIDQLIVYLKENNIYVIDLLCAPADSEFFWKSYGFVEFPDPPENYKFRTDDDKKLYKILSDHLQPNTDRQNDEIIQLWNDEPYRTKEMPTPSYSWNIEFIEGTKRLIKPIIQPANNDWRILWSIKGKTIIDGKVKRFTKEIVFGTFIIIDEL